MRGVVYTHAAIVVAFVLVGLAVMNDVFPDSEPFRRLAGVVAVTGLLAFFLCPIILLAMLPYREPTARIRWAILAEAAVCVAQWIALLPAIH